MGISEQVSGTAVNFAVWACAATCPADIAEARFGGARDGQICGMDYAAMCIAGRGAVTITHLDRFAARYNETRRVR